MYITYFIVKKNILSPNWLCNSARVGRYETKANNTKVSVNWRNLNK